MAAALNKVAPDLLQAVLDLGASSSRRGRCGGGDDPVVGFCPPVPPSRRRVLRRRRGTWEVVQGLAGGRRLRRRRRRVLAEVVLGDFVGCFAARVIGRRRLWSWLCGRLASSFGGFLRLRRGRGAGPGGVRGVSPAKIPNVNLWRSAKAAPSAMVLLQAKAWCPALAGASMVPGGEFGCTGTYRVRVYFPFSWRLFV